MKHRSMMIGSAPPPPLLFSANLQAGLGVAAKGSDTPTFTRATTATVEDFEGLVKSVLSGEARFKGARRVENLAAATEDMTDGIWTVAGSATATATTVEFDGTNNADILQNITITDDGGGAASRTWVLSVFIKLLSGTISGDSGVTLRVGGNAVTAASAEIGSEITSSSLRFSVAFTNDAAGTTIIPELECDDAVTLEITKWQVEETTGQSNQNPSEYVSVGVATGGELVTNGTFDGNIDGWTDSSTDTNTATYDSGEDALKLTTGGGGFSRADQLATTTLKTGKTYVITIRVKGSSSVGAYTLRIGTSQGGSQHSLITSFSSTTSFVTFSTTFIAVGTTLWVRLENGTTNRSDFYSLVSIKEADHGANIDGVAYPGTDGLGLGRPIKNGNTVTNNIVLEANGALIGAADSFADASGNFGYLAEGARTNICLRSQTFENAAWVKSNVTATDNDAVAPNGTTTAALLLGTAANGTAIQDLGVISSAEHRGGLWIKRKTGTGNIDLTINNGATWTTATVTADWTRFFSVAVTAANPDIGIRIVTDTDAVWVWNGQAEAAGFLSSDIPTVASSEIRNADVLTYDDANNILDAQGTISAEVVTDWGEGSVNGNASIISKDNSGRMYFPGSDTIITTADGTNTSNSPSGTTSHNNLTKVAATWGGALTSYFNGLPDPTPANYDGTFGGSVDIGIGTNAAGLVQLGGTIRLVKIFGKELSASQVAGL